MTYVPPDVDDASDRARRERAEVAYRRRRLDALHALRPVLPAVDYGFVVRLRGGNLAVIAVEDRDRLDRLVWQHRRALPAELRPKLPPFDPIVREREMVHA